MKQFSKEVDLRSRKSMTDFLVNHFRYNTMNSWNQSTSYANNVKVYNLGLSKEQENKLYAMLETSEFYTYISDLLSDFSFEHNHLWQVGFNGRSCGYLVLYHGYVKPSDTNPIVLCAVRKATRLLPKQEIVIAVDVVKRQEWIMRNHRFRSVHILEDLPIWVKILRIGKCTN